MSVVRAANLCVVPIIILALLLDVRTVGADRRFDVLAANDAVRVFEDGYGWPDEAPTQI